MAREITKEGCSEAAARGAVLFTLVYQQADLLWGQDRVDAIADSARPKGSTQAAEAEPESPIV